VAQRCSPHRRRGARGPRSGGGGAAVAEELRRSSRRRWRSGRGRVGAEAAVARGGAARGGGGVGAEAAVARGSGIRQPDGVGFVKLAPPDLENFAIRARHIYFTRPSLTATCIKVLTQTAFIESRLYKYFSTGGCH